MIIIKLIMESTEITIVKKLLLLGTFLQREGNRILQNFGLNQQQFVVLKEIHERGPISQKNICSRLLFEKSNVSKIIKKLAASGLIKVTPLSEDNRVCSLVINKKGNVLIEKCMVQLNNWNVEWLNSFSENELKQAVKMLDKLGNFAR